MTNLIIFKTNAIDCKSTIFTQFAKFNLYQKTGKQTKFKN